MSQVISLFALHVESGRDCYPEHEPFKLSGSLLNLHPLLGSSVSDPQKTYQWMLVVSCYWSARLDALLGNSVKSSSW